MSAEQHLTLHPLNTPRPLALDQSCWERNLAALRRQQPALADNLAQTALPDHWRACHALDDWATWRIEADSEPPCWLGSSSLPKRRAQTLLAAYETGELNASLPGIGSGAELRTLLSRLPAYKAVYVFEPDLPALAAVLRVHDFSAALDAWRFIPVDLANAEHDLNHLLNAVAGLLPPGNIVGLPEHASQQLQSIQAICQPLASRIIAQREAALSELLKSLPSAQDAQAVLLVGFQYSPLVEHAARLWQEAAKSTGSPVDVHLLSTPREAHLLALVEKLAKLGPARIICLDHGVNLLPAAVRDRAQPWFLMAESVIAYHRAVVANKENLPALRDKPAYAASPRITEELDAISLKSQPCHWAAPATLKSASSAQNGAIVFLDDLPSIEPAAYGIIQPTQKRIFTALLEVLRQAFIQDEHHSPGGYLFQAEQLAQLEITEPLLRSRLQQWISPALLPAVALADMAIEFVRLGRQVVGCGAGWSRLSEIPLVVESSALRWLMKTDRPIAAAVSMCPFDPLDPAVLLAAGRGIPLWLFDPQKSSIQSDLGERLRREEHYRAFSSRDSVQQAVRELSKQWEVVLRRAERARAHTQQQPFRPKI
jgi:hypothetical protein